MLSVESQATSLGTVVLAPMLGLAVDLAAQVQLWPAAAVGLIVSLLVAVRERETSEA